jgi:hypothetical protein
MKKHISQVRPHYKSDREDELNVSIRSKGFFKFLGETLILIALLQGLPVEIINRNPSINPPPTSNPELLGRA